MTFGNIFGLALYDREQRNVGTPERRRSLRPPISRWSINEGFEPSEPRLQAITAAPRVVPAGPSRKDHLRLPYRLVAEPKRRARVVRLLDIPSSHHFA